MILGQIIGKSSTTDFQFEVKEDGKKFEYLQVKDKSGNYVLAQVIEIEKTHSQTKAFCNIMGYRDKQGKLRMLRTPLSPGTEVEVAEDNFIKETLGLDKSKDSAYLGMLEGRKDLKVYLNLNKMLTRHVAVLAKSGSGKSYSVACLLEELLEKKVPVVIIDPHGEYSSLKQPNHEDKDLMKKFDIEPKGYLNQVTEYSPDIETNSEAQPIKLDGRNLSSRDIIHMMPAKLSNAQLGALYSALKNMGNRADFNDLIMQLEMEEGNVKWAIINIIEYIKKLDLFSDDPTRMSELVRPGRASIINLRGVSTEIQEIIVYKVIKDLFRERKKGNIHPFFLVVEEGHNYIPERVYGEAKSSAILRQIFSEGRKFGLGVCLVTQRPSRVEKNALSQITTQIILKVTNPNDIKAVSNSVEGITSETEKEIKNLPIGTALVTGIVDLPLFVNIRPRRSKHGGVAVRILGDEENVEEEPQDIDAMAEFKKKGTEDMMPIIKPKVSLKDLKVMNGDKKITTKLTPCLMINCENGKSKFNLLINLNNAHMIKNGDGSEGIKLEYKKLDDLSPQQRRVFKIALTMDEFKPAELFAKSGMQFSEIYEIIKALEKKKYFLKEGDIYKLNEGYAILSKLEGQASYQQIDYSSVTYDNKEEKKHGTKEILQFLNPFVKINNEKECWLIVHEVS